MIVSVRERERESERERERDGFTAIENLNLELLFSYPNKLGSFRLV